MPMGAYSVRVADGRNVANFEQERINGKFENSGKDFNL